MIHADGLTLQYPTKSEPSIEDVSVSVADGEALGVVGAVESGKTSLAMALAGFAPTVTGGRLDGDLAVAGADPREVDDDTRIGMVFEDYGSQLTQVRVLDEVTVPLLARGFGREAARERAREILERVRLEGYGDRRTWKLSGGEQQRVAIAAVLAMDAEAVVFDTATRALDPEGREEVSNIVASLKGEKTLVVTATDPQELVGVTDHVLVLDDGQRAAFGSADEILRDRDLLERAGVRPPASLRAAHELGLDADPVTTGEFAAAVANDDRWRVGPGVETPREVGTATDVDGDAPVAETPVPSAPETANDGGRPAGESAPGARGLDGDPLLELSNVTFSYDGESAAISDVDLAVPAGEVHALVGGNGAGKSTLVELIVGLLDPDEGAVRVDGEAVTDTSASGRGEQVALSFQNPDEQLSKRTVAEELRFPLEERQYDRSWLPFGGEQRYGDDYVDERVEAAQQLTGLDDDVLEEDPSFLPQGYRRLAAIASAVAPDPDVVIMDEPAVGLDAEGYRKVGEAVDRLREQGTAVLLIEHDMDFVCEVADRVTLLGDGETIDRGPPAQVFHRSNWDLLHDEFVRPPRVAQIAASLGSDALTLDALLETDPAGTEVAE